MKKNKYIALGLVHFSYNNSYHLYRRLLTELYTDSDYEQASHRYDFVPTCEPQIFKYGSREAQVRRQELMLIKLLKE